MRVKAKYSPSRSPARVAGAAQTQNSFGIIDLTAKIKQRKT